MLPPPLDCAKLFAVGGDDSDEDEEVDSNNDGGSLQSERTDKDEDAGEGTGLKQTSKPSTHKQAGD